MVDRVLRLVIAPLFAACAAALAGLALAHVAMELAGGDAHRAALWATMTFFAGAPLIVAYAARHARLKQSLTLPLLLVVLLALTFQGLLARGSFFTGDDWIHIVRAHSVSGLPDIDYLGKVVFIHYAPGLRLGYWGLDRVAPLDWAAGQIGLLVLFAGSLLLLDRIFRKLFGERPSNRFLLLLFGTSILLVTSFLWFADGLHKLPSTFLSLLAIDTWLTWHRTRSKFALLVAVGAVSLGSLFYVKTLLVPLYLLLIRLLFLEERPRRALRIIWQERWAWLAFAPTCALYLWNYFANYAGTRGPAPSLHLLGNYLWLSWYKGVTPALAGVEIGPEAARSGVLFATVAQLALIGVIGLSIHLKRSAWRAWVFWGVAFSVNAALVGLGRLGTMGLDRVGKELRYDTEMSWLLPLALGFAFFPATVAGEGATAGTQRRRIRIPRLATAAAIGAYLIAAIATGAGISSSWRTNNSGPSKNYVENLERDVGRLTAGGARPVAIDDQVPAFLIGSADAPLNRLERLIPAVEPRLQVVAAAQRPMQVGDDGHVGAAVLQPLVAGDDALSGSGRVRLVRGHSNGRCVEGSAELRFESKKPLAGQSLYALVSYEVPARASSPGRIWSVGPAHPGPVPLDRPRGTEFVNLGRPLHAKLPAGARVCMRSMAVGWLGANGR